MMIRRICFREYRREYLHALRNGKSEAEAAEKAMLKTREKFAEATVGCSEINQREMWGDILERLIDWEETFRLIPIDKAKIPAKVDMPAAELKTLKTQQGQE